MSKVLPRVLQWAVALALPVLLIVANLRIVTGHWFVHWEYGKASFPADPYGFSTEDRAELATVSVDYLATSADISLLAQLRLPDGEAAFNARELQHMDDVQVVFDGLTVAGIVAAAVVAGGIAALWVLAGARHRIPAALVAGSLITLGVLVALGGYMLLNWNQFFTDFHRVFFEGSSWQFLYSDTLIRLFPMQFWIDVAAMIVGLLILEAIVIELVGWRWSRSFG